MLVGFLKRLRRTTKTNACGYPESIYMDRARNDESFLEPEMRHGFVILLLATNDDLESEKIQTDDFLVVHPRYEHRRDCLTDLSSARTRLPRTQSCGSRRRRRFEYNANRTVCKGSAFVRLHVMFTSPDLTTRSTPPPGLRGTYVASANGTS